MALSVTRARVKEKSGITGTDYDATIDNLITEQVSVVEFAIRSDYIEDTGNTGLQNTLNLGATEIVCGEFLAQLLREAGAADTFAFGSLTVTPFTGHCVSDPFAMRVLGWKRLRPYLKLDPKVPVSGGVLTGTDREVLEVPL